MNRAHRKFTLSAGTVAACGGGILADLQREPDAGAGKI